MKYRQEKINKVNALYPFKNFVLLPHFGCFTTRIRALFATLILLIVISPQFLKYVRKLFPIFPTTHS